MKILLKKIKDTWYNIFIFASFIFFVIYLYKLDLYQFPKILSVPFFVISTVLFFFSFFIYSYAWHRVLLKGNCPVKFSDSTYSYGVASIAKYIPGKIGTIVGQAASIFENYNYRKRDIISLTFIEQFIVLWVGLILGASALFFLEGAFYYGLIILTGWLILSIIIFTDLIHRFINNLFTKIFKKDIIIPSLSIKDTFEIILIFILFWLVVGLSFFFFTKSIVEGDVNLNAGLGIILAMNIGLLVIFIPAGVGIREGILIIFLKTNGFTFEESTIISISHRILNFFCEILFFIVALFFYKLSRKKSDYGK